MARKLLTKVIDDVYTLLQADTALAASVKYWAKSDAIEPDQFPALVFIRDLTTQVRNVTIGRRTATIYPLNIGVIVKNFDSVELADEALDELLDLVIDRLDKNPRINGTYANSTITGWQYSVANFANNPIAFFPAAILTINVEVDKKIDC